MSIIAAAIKFAGRNGMELICHVPRPARHHSVLNALWHQFPDDGRDRTAESYEGETQGFLTDRGEFLDRRAALLHVRECGQTMLRQMGVGYQGDELFSEDLWGASQPDGPPLR